MDPVDAVKARQTGRSESEKESFYVLEPGESESEGPQEGDEKKARLGAAGAPLARQTGPTRLMAPQEPSGGSWISRVAAATMAGAAPAA